MVGLHVHALQFRKENFFASLTLSTPVSSARIATSIERTRNLEVADSRPSQIAGVVCLPASMHILL